MQQTALTQSAMGGLLGLPMQGMQGGAGALGNGLIFGGNGGLSFRTFLMMTPGQSLGVTNEASALLQNKISALAPNAGLNGLLQAQAAANIDGTKGSDTSLWQMLRVNMDEMFKAMGTSQSAIDSAFNDTAQNGQIVVGNTGEALSKDILFLFNAPIGLNKAALAQASLTGGAATQGKAFETGASGLGNPLSNDIVQLLILQTQSGTNGADAGAALTAEDLAALSSQITASLESMNLEEFGAFKQMAFADLAPFLTQAKTVDMGDGKIMKITQGPAFLSKDSSDSVAQGLEGLMVMLVPVQQTAAQAASAQAGLQAAQTTIPVQNHATGQGFSDAADLLAQAAAGGAGQVAEGEVDGEGRPVKGAASSGFLGMVGKMTQGLSGTQQQSTVQSALLGSSALNPAGQGTSAAHMLVFENIFNQHGMDGAHDPALLDPTIDGGLIKADLQSPAFKASTLVHTRAAGYPHPTTQGVAQHITAMASKTPQGDRQMRLHLDPPELGNVMIQIKFGKDNTVKAHLVAERPETLSLLQKDSASLEKALQDAGLDVSGDSLSFDLQQGSGENEFGDFKGGNNGQNGNDAAEIEDNAPALIETQMTVFVDPQTGQQRVNMMV